MFLKQLSMMRAVTDTSGLTLATNDLKVCICVSTVFPVPKIKTKLLKCYK